MSGVRKVLGRVQCFFGYHNFTEVTSIPILGLVLEYWDRIPKCSRCPAINLVVRRNGRRVHFSA